MTPEQELRAKALEIAVLIQGGHNQDRPPDLDRYRQLASDIEAYICEAPIKEPLGRPRF